jgi:hypothetical protein
MSSNETQNSMFTFTDTEHEIIKSLTKQYRSVTSEALRVQRIIEEAEKELAVVIEKAEAVKADEIKLFEEMAIKYDLDIKTLQNMAANQILRGDI